MFDELKLRTTSYSQYITPRRDVSDLQSQARGRVTVIRYIPTRRDVTGLYPAGYYGLRHTAARLLWSLIGNRFCVILAHWYSVHRLSFFGEGLRSVCLATCTYVYAESS